MSVSDTNKSVVARLYDEVFSKWNYAVLPELVSEGFRCHFFTPDISSGPAGIEQFYGNLRQAFPDVKYTVEDMVAEGDRVVVRWTWHCTHEGDFLGIPATGKKATVPGMAIYRLADGKCVERWVELSLFQLSQQLSTKRGDE